MNLVEAERAKYDEIWSLDEYRKYSPGLENVERFMKVLAPKSGSTLVDIGCGTGEAGMQFEDHGLRVKWVDITDAALHEDIPRARFSMLLIWSIHWSQPLGYDYGFCCDVMEHIPIEFVMLSLFEDYRQLPYLLAANLQHAGQLWRRLREAFALNRSALYLVAGTLKDVRHSRRRS